MVATMPVSVKQQINGRVEWAWAHVQKAKALIEAWGRTDPYRVDVERDPSTGFYSFRLGEVKPTPPELGFVVADAVHNLRSALDNTMWALRDPNFTDERTLRLVSFLHGRDEHAWKSWEGSVRAVIAKDILDDLRDFQPYLGYTPARDAFGGLDELWQASKHRIPTFALQSLRPAVAMVVMRQGNMDISGGPGPFYEGDEIAQGRPHPGPLPEVEPHFTMELAFERGGPCAGVPVYTGLVDLHDKVREEILPRFLARL